MSFEPGAWTFDERVTSVFDDMLQRSIPDYDAMRLAVDEVGAAFVRPGTDVVDLGCSRGEALAPYVGLHGGAVRCVGVEVSAPMLAAARERWARARDEGLVEILDLDLAGGYPDVRASLTLLVLTLQFTPLEARGRILRDARAHTEPGGALVLVEKVQARDAHLDGLLVELHERRKRANGYTQEEIDRKRLSLAGVLRPLTAEANEALLREAGFDAVEPIWRSLNFAAWVAVRTPVAP